MALLPVVLAVIVLAFSLSDQQGPLGTNLAPDAYNGQNAYGTMHRFAAEYPDRRPGSTGDDALASDVAGSLTHDNFGVRIDTFKAKTVDGTRTLENVIATRAGLGNGSIVIVAHRDSLQSPSTADLSGTAVMLEMARVLSGQSLKHTVVLASTSGSVGAVGATRLARSLQQPVDAVLVLGDLAGSQVHGPTVVPWSDGQSVAPPVLRKTLAAALGAQAGLGAGSTGLGGQLAHLALPLSPTEQAPFGGAGQPAVLLSVSGERTPPSGEPTSLNQITGLGRTVLQSINAIDATPSIPSPSSYLVFSGKSIPAWAVRLLVLALILPVLVATIDGLARARRRGHSIARWSAWVLAAAVPFALVVAVVVIARVTGLIVAPPAPVGGGAITLHAGQIAALCGMALLVLGGLVWLRPALIWLLGPTRSRQRDEGGSYGPGAAAAILLLLCLVTLVIWVANPFAALLLVPALHLWLWIVVPDVRLRAPVAVVMLLAGIAAPALIAATYATTLGLGPVEAAWSWVLLLAGGGVGVLAALEWCVVLGCAFSVAVVAVAAAREPRPEDAPVTVRGPVTYAGPGSLGGTESALRR
ncbi:MAG TPA: M28 family peptidase [Solirubrobacteraceae bacterium]